MSYGNSLEYNGFFYFVVLSCSGSMVFGIYKLSSLDYINGGLLVLVGAVCLKLTLDHHEKIKQHEAYY